MMWSQKMHQFWDAKAREHSLHFIASDVIALDSHDEATFFASGEEDVQKFLMEAHFTQCSEKTMLEIGCGIGRMTHAFASRFKTVVAIDISSEMIAQAQQQLASLPNVQLFVCNGTDLHDFPDESFDFVFSYITFQHIPDSQITLGYIHEIGRVLKKGGISYFQVNTKRRPFARLRRNLRLRARIQRLQGKGDYVSPAWSGSSLSVNMLYKAVRESGMQMLHLTGEGTQYTWVLAER